jgi:hypothetical protein
VRQGDAFFFESDVSITSWRVRCCCHDGEGLSEGFYEEKLTGIASYKVI